MLPVFNVLLSYVFVVRASFEINSFKSCNLPQGFLAFLHLANSGVYTLMWPDLFHRLDRRVAQALNHHSCSEIKGVLKLAMKLFRCSRAPFNSGRFGEKILNARRELLAALKAGQCDDLVDMWLSAVARDHENDSFDVHDLIHALEISARTLDVQ